MTVTSAQLAAAATGLAALRDALQLRVDDFGAVISSAQTATGLLAQVWRGELPTEMNELVGGYVDAVAGVVGAADSARATVDEWATAATAASERLATLEARRAGAQFCLGSDLDVEWAAEELRAATDGIDDESTEWERTCQTKGEALQTCITVFQSCTVEELGTVDQRSALLGDGFTMGMAAWAAGHDMDLDLLDRTGRLQQEAERRLEEFSSSEYAGLMYAVIETMKQADIDKMNGKSSRDDWLLSTDPDIVRFRLQIAAELAGIELTDEQLDAITADIVTIALFGAATDGDTRGAVDDRFDENADIEAGLDADGAITEREWELPESPSDTDQYVDAWLQAQWQGSPGLVDIAKMLIVPDFAVMNPWSDEFSPGWAIVEVIGIVPVGKLGTFAKLGRLADLADDASDVSRLFDETIDILSDGARVADDAAPVGDDILGVTDDIAEAADDVPSGAHDAAGAADEAGDARRADGDTPDPDADPDGDGPDGDPDDVDPHTLPKDDPAVLARTQQISDPAMEQIQQEVDRIWAETQNAIPDATPQQLGTRAHRELAAWIQEHGDELVDPDSGYRVRAEISFDSRGDVANYGSRGSIRPDVIVERQYVRPDGELGWQVVEVADLKTGQAGISTSWQTRVDSRLAPTSTTEIRPTAPGGPPVPS